jgi:hypothetical protein
MYTVKKKYKKITFFLTSSGIAADQLKFEMDHLYNMKI